MTQPMIKLVHSEDETMLADAARGFLDGAAPVSHLRGLRDAGRSHDPDLWGEMARMGWAGVLVPETHGGADMGHAAAGILAAQMGQTLAVSPFLSTAVMAATALRQVADGRTDQALRQIAAGQRTYALAIDEGRKFDPGRCDLRAVREGNGYRLSGRKGFVVDGALADRVLVQARTDDGLVVFDLPAGAEGIERRARAAIDSRDSADITLNGVVATGDDLLGRADQVLRPAILAGQAALAAEMTGLVAGAFGMTIGYLNERKQFGVTIGQFQALQHRAAHLWCEQEVTAAAVLNAGRQMDAALQDAALAVSIAKARATATAILAVSEGVQMHGGIGMTDAFDMGLFMKRARVCAEWLGDYSYHAEIIGNIRGI